MLLPNPYILIGSSACSLLVSLFTQFTYKHAYACKFVHAKTYTHLPTDLSICTWWLQFFLFVSFFFFFLKLIWFSFTHKEHRILHLFVFCLLSFGYGVQFSQSVALALWYFLAQLITDFVLLCFIKSIQVPVILDATTFSIKLQRRRFLVLESLNQAPIDSSSGTSYGTSASCSGSSKTGTLDF